MTRTMGLGFTWRVQFQSRNPAGLSVLLNALICLGRIELIQRQIEQQNIDARLSKKAPLRRLSVLLHELFDLVLAQATGKSDAGNLKLSGFGTDMRIKSAGG